MQYTRRGHSEEKSLARQFTFSLITSYAGLPAKSYIVIP